MRPPRDKDVIEIISTVRCELACSSCHQLVGMLDNSNRPSDMTPENFRTAVRSLRDWCAISRIDGKTRVAGVFGGNATLHPQFPELCEIIAEELPDKSSRGLLVNSFNGYGDIIKETFGWLNLNAHGSKKWYDEMEASGLPMIKESRLNRSWHSPILVALKDKVTDREERLRLIEACDVNIRWSGAIRQARDGKLYVWFCEVASAMAEMYGENQGVPISDDWWKWNMDRFQHQVDRWCHSCGVPLRLRGHMDYENIEDVSPTHLAKVKELAPKRKIQLHQIGTPLGPRTTEMTDYMRRRATVVDEETVPA